MFGSLILYDDFFQARVRELCYGGSLQKYVDIIIAFDLNHDFSFILNSRDH